jgi:hypothetical protein
MNKQLYLGICLILLAMGAFAQQKCGNDAALQALEGRQPGYLERFHRLEMAAQGWVETNAQARYTWPSVTIPVVVHIVYNTPGENLPDSQIVSQIEVLNEDFRRLNADTTQTRNIFRPFAVDTKIQFCLAAQDPSGNPTTGITRTSTAVTGFTFDDRVKFDTSGGKDAWNPAHYLNIWVCNLTTANGYAYYPNIQPAYDGVVLNYNVVGRVGPVIAPYNKGRTATHEVGHWLGLYHPFEGFFAGTGCGGSDTTTCASRGDHLCDTPGDITPSYGCDTLQNSCTDSPIDYPDQIENYMDYADDACCNMFSSDQADRMNGFLYTARMGLLASLGCVAPGSATMDAAVVDILYPQANVCSSPFTPRVRIANVSANPLTSLTIDYQVDGGAVTSFPWTGNLASGAWMDINLPPATAANGLHDLSVTARLPNGLTDANPSNDNWMRSFELGTGSALMPGGIYEDFESTVFPPAGWRIENPDNNYYTWEKAYAPLTSSNWAKINNFYYGSSGTSDALISPLIQYFSNCCTFSFDYAYMAPASAFYSDTLNVYWSSDCGETWNLFYSNGGFSLATVPNAGFAPYVPQANQTGGYGGYLDNLIPPGTATFQMKFENKSGWGNDLWIDNIRWFYLVNNDPSTALSALQLHPNPAHDRIQADLKGLPLPAGEVEIVSLLGQTVYGMPVSEGITELEMDVRDLPQGMYILRYVSDAGGVQTKSWIKY